MRILVLTKRQYTGKDLLGDRFGRLRELPLELAKLGHDVAGICLSYRSRREGPTIDASTSCDAQVCWHSLNLGNFILPGLVNYFLKAKRLGEKFKPDLVWASSDSFHVIFGLWLARCLKVKCVLDLYDNFESFTATRFPGITPLFKRSVRAADGIACVSRLLAELVSEDYKRTGRTLVLENAVRPDIFYPQDRNDCRKRLGLPENIRLIGTAGALYVNRGINTLLQGYGLLSAENPHLHLAVAGPRERRIRIPGGPRVHDFGILPLEKVPVLINALDVAVICNRDSLFGRYCFPQKTYEIMACRVPLIAAASGSMKDLLAEHPECLFDPEKPESLAQAIRLQLMNPVIPNRNVPSWADQAKRLEAFFKQVLADERAPLCH